MGVVSWKIPFIHVFGFSLQQ